MCSSFQVNISNTWTLPQEGFSVFYRFFRDKISWFEADAVCQFHHANLVTGKRFGSSNFKIGLVRRTWMDDDGFSNIYVGRGGRENPRSWQICTCYRGIINIGYLRMRFSSTHLEAACVCVQMHLNKYVPSISIES